MELQLTLNVQDEVIALAMNEHMGVAIMHINESYYVFYGVKDNMICKDEDTFESRKEAAEKFTYIKHVYGLDD